MKEVSALFKDRLSTISDLIAENLSEVFDLVSDLGSINIEYSNVHISEGEGPINIESAGVAQTLFVELEDESNFVYVQYETISGVIKTIDLFDLNDAEALAVCKAVEETLNI